MKVREKYVGSLKDLEIWREEQAAKELEEKIASTSTKNDLDLEKCVQKEYEPWFDSKYEIAILLRCQTLHVQCYGVSQFPLEWEVYFNTPRSYISLGWASAFAQTATINQTTE